jgi:hypothetical protein
MDAPRVARFFLTQYTKAVKMIPNYHTITKWPSHISNGRKILQMTKKYSRVNVTISIFCDFRPFFGEQFCVFHVNQWKKRLLKFESYTGRLGSVGRFYETVSAVNFCSTKQYYFFEFAIDIEAKTFIQELHSYLQRAPKATRGLIFIATVPHVCFNRNWSRFYETV